MNGPINQIIRLTPLRWVILSSFAAAELFVAYIHTAGFLVALVVNVALYLAIQRFGNPWAK
jgi:hypothetical protein